MVNWLEDSEEETRKKREFLFTIQKLSPYLNVQPITSKKLDRMDSRLVGDLLRRSLSLCMLIRSAIAAAWGVHFNEFNGI